MKMRVFLTLAVVATGCFTGCTTVRHNTPPAHSMAAPGPGVGGPGPGVLGAGVVPASAVGNIGGAGCVSCGPEGGIPSGGMMMPGMGANVQILFNRPEGMELYYDVVGDGSFGSEPLYVPGRLEFPQGGIYRLKLTNIQGREGVELYPTVEVARGNPRTAAYLAHNAIPIQFNVEDFEQVLTGNFVTKVIYLPDPEFQGDALVGVDVLVSNRLEPGLDPIVEADRRGSILAIVRIGNKDIEMSGAGMGGALAGGVPMMAGPGMGYMPGNISGVTTPQYGMTMSGTPIGLPGPPHIPLGAPASLKKHTIRNTTRMHMPAPVKHMKINVRQTPGYSYPAPVNKVRIHERNVLAAPVSGRPSAYCPE